LAEDHRTPEPAADRERELDAEIEELTRQIAERVNGAGPERRQDLREYAIELLKERTELADAPRAAAGTADRTNPLGMAILLGLVSVPLLFLFLPVGLTMLAVAMVMGLWGILATIFRRSSPTR